MIFGFLLIAVGMLALALQRFYSAVPARELKRLAARGDELATKLYAPVAYGERLRLLLWIVVIFALSGGYVLVVNSLHWALALAVLVFSSVGGFVFFPSTPLSVRTVRVAVWFSGGITYILARVGGVLGVGVRILGGFREVVTHTRLYEKSDLLHLFRTQKNQVDNRINVRDLALAERALTLSDKTAVDVLVPRGKLRKVSADEAVGPVFLDELHAIGLAEVPVTDGQGETVCGMLSVKDAVAANHGGKVRDLLRSEICYVNETFSLHQVLDALRTTGHKVAVVINNFEEFVGVVSLENVLSHLLGEKSEPLVSYENKMAVAAVVATELADSSPDQNPDNPDASTEPTEVLE